MSDSINHISGEMPVVIPLTRLSIEDLPDYYEEVKRRERSGYSSSGVPQKRWQRYAVRPLTTKEHELLEETGALSTTESERTNE